MFRAALSALNNSAARGRAELVLEGDQLTVRITTNGLVPGQPHAQHIHGIGRSECPPPSADTDGDGIVSTPEGQPFYGPILVSLTTTGDTSPDSALAIERFPVASEEGLVDYERTFTVDESVADDLARLQIVQHGIDVNGNGMYDFSAGPSPLDPDLPLEATAPATCGTID